MKKIRIGNDIVIKWRVTINGEEVNLEGLDLSLYISTTYQPRKAIAFTVAGNEITATYNGTEQKVTGVYRLTLYRNEGENAQNILDACDAFELVSCSCLTTDVAFGGAEVELPIADLGIGVPGLSAYEIAVSEGFEGTQEEWLASLSAASEAAAAECREFTEAAKIDERERQNNEALRVTAENERAANETTRQSAEADRATNERNRATAEQQRVTNETARINAESSRATAETARQTNETARQDAEQGRVTAEQQRADAEAAREEEFATFEGKIAAKEDAANKVTSIGADADDQHYPSAKAVLDVTQELAKAIEDKYWYGVEWDLTISDPTCTRIGNMELHRTLPVQSQMRGCLLADDGTVNKYLNPDDWTSEVRDGSQGMVMVELPRYFRKFEEDGNKIRLKLSLLPLDGFHEVPKKYVSAYEAAMERSTGKLCSVVNDGTNYRGGSNDSSWDGTYRSQLGMPVTNIDRNSFRTAARKRGSVNWNIYTYDINKDLYWLYVCEYATLNSQATYTEELTAEGYHRGGLGNGLSNFDNLNNYNKLNPICKCGHTDSCGNNSGNVLLVSLNEDGSKANSAYANRYRGVENPFAHFLKIVDDLIFIIKDVDGAANVTAKLCKDFTKFIDGFGDDNYKVIYEGGVLDGYVRRILFGEYGDIICTSTDGGSTSTYYCDSSYQAITNVNNRLALVGGVLRYYYGNGFLSMETFYGYYFQANYIGTRLTYYED